jgi:hypothetical protein
MIRTCTDRCNATIGRLSALSDRDGGSFPKTIHLDYEHSLCLDGDVDGDLDGDERCRLVRETCIVLTEPFHIRARTYVAREGIELTPTFAIFSHEQPQLTI